MTSLSSAISCACGRTRPTHWEDLRQCEKVKAGRLPLATGQAIACAVSRCAGRGQFSTVSVDWYGLKMV